MKDRMIGKSYEEILSERAEKIQIEVHRSVEMISETVKDGTIPDYQDMTNVIIYRMIAELQLKVERLSALSINSRPLR